MQPSKLQGVLILALSCFLINDVVSNEMITPDNSAASSPVGNQIIIQPDYWNGTECLANGVPWQVPASIYKEAENCNKEDTVLELGTGGSTIFFARRCRHVIAIETDPSWARAVQVQLDKLNLKNVTLISISDSDKLESFLNSINEDEINIFSVDTAFGYNRSFFVNDFIGRGISKQLRMVVLDNYGAKELFPLHYDKEILDPREWDIMNYDDSHWFGNGTKLYIRKI